MRFPKVSTTNINGLPLGYTEVEYLEGTGTQYIDTGIAPNYNTKIETVISGINDNSYPNGVSWFFGSRTANQVNGFGVFYNKNEQKFYSAFGDIQTSINLSKTNIYDQLDLFVIDNSGSYLNGTKQINFNSADFTGTYSIYLYTVNLAGALGYITACKIHYCKIYDNNTLVRDFIPCLDSNNRPCMYDKVEDKPYYNLGTGEFTYGKKIYGVEYLESTGTQYIDTGYSSNDIYSNGAFEIICSTAGMSNRVVGCGGLTNNNKNINLSFSGGGYILGLYGNKWNSDTFSYNINTKYKIKFGFTTTQQNLYVNDTLVETTNYSWDSTDNYPLRIFKTNADTYTKASKVYSFKLWVNDILVRDFIPVKDENNVGYMFDKVSHTLYANNGTGAFVVGKDTLGKSKAKIIRTKTTVSGLPYGYTEVEYLQSTGTQYIDTGLSMPNGFRATGSYLITTLNNTGGIIGTFTNAAPYKRNFYDYTYPSGNRWLVGYGGDAYQYFGSAEANTLYTFDVSNVLNKEHLITNGTSYTVTPSGTPGAKTSFNLYMFALNVSNNPDNYAKIKLFKIKVYNENDVLVRDYIPALDENDRPCMYDKVEGKPYYNQGTGEFTYGPKIIPVDYLENTETGSSRNWINTGIVTDNNTKWEVKVSYNDTSTGKLMGSGIGGDTRFNLGIESSKFRFGFGSGWFDANSHVSTSDTNPHIWILDSSSGTGTIDGYTATSTSTFGTNTYPIGLFGRTNNTSSVESSNTTVGKIYYSKIWKNNVLVQDLIPVCDENNIGYMYDKITHTLYANAGTGNFVVGDEKIFSKVRFIEDTSVISEYTKLKCLISTGIQYIDTGFKPNNNTEYEVSGYMNPSGVFGVARWSGESTYDTFGAHSVTANPLDYYGRYSDNKYYNGPASAFNNNIIWKHTKNNISITNADNGTVYVNENITTATFQSTYNIWIFAFNNMGSILARSVGCKMYYFKIWDNNALIRDYIPVLRNSDNKPGMYDRVTKTFFTNQGTGEFTYETL